MVPRDALSIILFAKGVSLPRRGHRCACGLAHAHVVATFVRHWRMAHHVLVISPSCYGTMSGVPARLASFVRWCPLTFVKAQMIPPAAPEDA